ncbi:hypothetical protein [Paludibaculum fermentans]|uniref:hypothetical protein n=1 Tax=Paludibaculum fermentans TaxID=1473598 RepID=UPI003EBB78CA
MLLAQAPAGSIEERARARQTAMGREYARQLRSETVVLENSAVRGYVDRMGRMLAAQMPGPPPSFEFTVAEFVACPAIREPATLPGGFVFFPARLLAAARNESEFAAVVAHAVAHEVLHRVPVPNPRKNGATIPLMMLGSWTSDCQGRRSVPLGYAAALKQQELEADALAWKALDAAGFDARALGTYVRRAAGATATDLQHVEIEERLAALRSLDTVVGQTRQDSVDFETCRAELQRFVEALSPARRAPSLVRAKQP